MIWLSKVFARRWIFWKYEKTMKTFVWTKWGNMRNHSARTGRFSSVSLQPNSGLGRLIVEVSGYHTIRHTHTLTHTQMHGRTPLNEWSARRRGRYLHYTQHTQETNFHARSGIRTCDSSSQATADLDRMDTGIGRIELSFSYFVEIRTGCLQNKL